MPSKSFYVEMRQKGKRAIGPGREIQTWFLICRKAFQVITGALGEYSGRFPLGQRGKKPHLLVSCNSQVIHGYKTGMQTAYLKFSLFISSHILPFLNCSVKNVHGVMVWMDLWQLDYSRNICIFLCHLGHHGAHVQLQFYWPFPPYPLWHHFFFFCKGNRLKFSN